MKNIYNYSLIILSVLLLSAQAIHGQPWSENFDTQTSNSYGTGTITINSRDWTRQDAGNFSYANSSMGSYAFTINDDKPGAHITTPELNTCGTVSFKYAYINGNSSNVFILQKSNNGSSWSNIDTRTLGASADESYVDYSFDVNDASGTIYIRILSDDQNAHLFIEDFSVTAYSSCSGEPTAQATDIALSGETSSSIDVSWTAGTGGDQYILVVKEAGSVSWTPTDGTDYSGDTGSGDFSSAADQGSGNKVVFAGSGTSTTVTGLTASTTYYFQVFHFCSSASNDYLTSTGTGNDGSQNTLTLAASYCASSGNMTYGTAVTLVDLNTISNSTGTKTAAYNDYTAISTDLQRNSSYDLSIELFTDGGFTIYSKVWIDWNQNSDFTDPGEEYDLGSTSTDGPTANSPLNFTVPSGASLGSTRMRVSAKYDSYATSCEEGYDGEVEDYTINVTAGGSTPTITLSTSSLDFENVYTGYTSLPQEYTVTGTDLSADISVTAPTGIEIASSCSGTYGSSLTLTQSGGSVNAAVYARYTSGAVSNPITHTSTGATQKDIAISETASSTNLPGSYYSTATGTGATLKTNLHNIIDGHTERTYAQLWTDFQSTDDLPNGYVWDMYSDIPCGTPSYVYTFITHQCGSYGAEGDCYNREHSFPKSWFGVSSGNEDSHPAGTDLHHLVPTDGYVNGGRGNLVFGEVSSPSTTYTNGSKRGPNSYSGSSGDAFEPIDDYKGDFARIYFYMATRYEDEWVSWVGNDTNGDMVIDANTYPAFDSWALNMLIEWHTNDPVDQKEMSRNDAIYSLQNNRNPFIDNPSYVDAIWGSNPSLAVTPSTIGNLDYVEGAGPSSEGSFTLSGTNLEGTEVTVTAPTNFEVSLTSGGTFGSSVTVSYTAPTLSNTTVYVRLVSGLSANSYSGNITCSDNGSNPASDATVAVSGQVTSSGGGGGCGFIISEYVEGSSNNKYLELYNGTGSSLDLTGYELRLYANGATSPSQTESLTGSLAAGSTLVFKNSSATIYGGAATSSPVCNFNGNDAIALYDGSTNIDVLGTIGSSANFAEDVTLVRKSTVTQPNSTYTASEWDSYSQDDVSDLGSHTMNCASGPSITNISHTPSPVYAVNTVSVSADVTDTDGVSSVELHWGLTSGSLGNTIAMGNGGSGDTYTANTDIPAQAAGATVYYEIYASDNNSDETTSAEQSYTVLYDSDSEAYDSGSQPAAANISSTFSGYTDVFEIQIEDLGTADGSHTDVTNIRIKPHTTNTADWTDHINDVKLNNGSDITIGTPDITDTYIDIPITAGNLQITDGTSDIITVQLQINNTGITDNAILSFMVDADAHGFTADAAGSDFAGTFFLGDFNSNDFTIDVDPTEIQYLTQPTDVNVGSNISPAVEAAFTDANGNIDLDFATIADIRITATGATLTGSPVDITTNASGIATFSTLQFSTAGTGVTLTANDLDGALGTPGAYSKISDAFNVTEVNACGLEEFDGGTTAPDGWSFTGISGVYSTSGNYGISSPSVKFDDTGDIIETADVSNPQELSFWIKGQGTDASSALLVEGWDGASWNTIENITNSIPTSGTTVSYTSGIDSYTKFRFTYTKSSGNLAFDDVFVDCESCIAPENNASSFVFTNVQGTQMDISYTPGADADYALVVAKESAPVDWSPTNGTTYTANSVFGSGTELGTGNYVVYNGDNTDLPFTLTGLTSNTTYHFTVFGFNDCITGGEQYLTTGALTGAQGTQDYIAAGSISGAPFCVNASTGASVDVPFTYGAIGSYSGATFTAQLSDASGDFSSPVSLGTIAYDGSGSQQISGNIPAGTSSGTGYRIRVISDSPATTGTDNGSDIEIIDAPQNVTSVSGSPANNEIALSWTNPNGCFDEIIVAVHSTSIANSPDDTDGYTVSSGDYNDLSNQKLTSGSDEVVVYSGTGNSVNITGLQSGTTYYIKVFTRYNTDWSSGTEINVQTLSNTVLAPGDLIIIGYDSDIYNILANGDRVYLTNFVKLLPGTEFSYVNSRFEAGALANERTMEWHGGSTDPSEDPGIYKFTYTGSSEIPAGSVIAFDIDLNDPESIYIDGVDRTSDFNITSVTTTRANISIGNGDQLWLVQGDFTDKGDYHSLDGTVLFGLTLGEPWVDITSACNGDNSDTQRESRLHPDLRCFNLDLSVAGQDYYYYKNESNHNDSKRNLLVSVMSSGNWAGSGSGTNDLDITEDYTGATLLAIGKSFVITAGNSGGYWVGDDDTNWFNCSNWEGLAVPDENTNVIINTASSGNADIDYTAANSDEFGDIAKCKNLTISGRSLIIDTDGDVLEVHGDLSITGGSLDMNDANPAGSLYLYGDWDNQVGTTGFAEGYGTVYLTGTDARTLYGNGGESFSSLYQNSDFTTTATSDLTVTGELNISNGIFDAGTYTLSGGGDLTMSGGTLKLAKLGVTLPELNTGTYNITGGSIELYGSGDQILRGTRDYYSLTFSSSGNKTVSSALSDIDGIVTISDNAVLNLASNTFEGTAELHMNDNSRLRISKLNETLPQLTGSYSLFGGTVELYGTDAAQTHSLRTGVTYNKVELNSTAANTDYDAANVVLSTGDLTVRSNFDVNSPTVLKVGGSSAILGNGTFNLNDGSTLKYGDVNGITASDASGNIQTSTRNFSSSASYGLTGSTSPQSVGDGLPASIVNFYLEKTLATDEVSLGTVTVNGDMILREGLLKITAVYASPAILENASGEGDLTIEDGAVLQIEAGAAMTVKGDEFINGDDASRLVIKSDAISTGSLIMTPTNAEATVERYVTGDQWHFMYPPLSTIPTVSYIQEGSNTNPNLYSYNELTEDYWEGNSIYGTSGWTSETGSTNLRTDKGYIFNRYQMADKTFSQTGGVLNVADKDFSVSYSTHTGTFDDPEFSGTEDWSLYDGWNLIGNPFSAAVDWESVSLGDIEAGVYYYNGSNYVYYTKGESGTPPIGANGGSRYLPAGQGFMVKANAGGGSFTIPASARVHNSQNFWKDSQTAPNLLRLQIEKDGFTDETVIRTLPPESNVTNLHDGLYDAHKRFSWDASKPQLFSQTADSSFAFAINSMTEINEHRVVPLGLYTGEAGDYQISMTENSFENMHLWVEDTHTGDFFNLLENSDFIFTQAAEDNTNRYLLHFDMNFAPVVENTIPNQEIPTDKFYSYEVPEETFSDANPRDELNLSASLSSGCTLPQWLNFDPELRKFYGTPFEAQVLNIKITAWDSFGESAETEFTLEVLAPTARISTGENSITLYPNPANEHVIVKAEEGSIRSIRITDVSGKVIFEQEYRAAQTEINISQFPQGLYIFEIRSDSGNVRKSLIVE